VKGYGVYTGEIVNKMAHGYGRWVSLDTNSIYEGQFKLGKPSGFGMFITPESKTPIITCIEC